MKRFLLSFTLLLSASTAYAQNPTTFSWAAGVGGDPASKFTLKCGSTPGGPYLNIRDISGSPLPTTFLVNQIVTARGTYFCVVTASNIAGESGPSNEVTFSLQAPPTTPTGLRVQ